MTGYPICWLIFTASSASSINPMYPGTVETPASWAIFLDVILSPMLSIAPTGGPMNATFAAAKASANFGFSERNP